MGCGWLGKEWLPRQQRHVILVCTCFQQFFMAGFVFGWPSLVSLLEKDGQYSELCDAISSEGNRSSEYPPPTWGSQSSSISTSSIPQSSSYVLRLCEAQELRFNLTITLAFVMTSLAGVVMGSVSDVIGPKLSNLVGGSLEIIGVALLSISDSKSFDAFLPAILLVAFGGTSLYYCNFHIVNMYPERRSLLIALTSIVFTVSGLSALIVQFMYEYGGISWRITLKGYACLYTFFIVFSVIILAPFEAYKPTDTVRLTPFWREPSFKRLLSKVVILHEKQVNFSELHESVEMESRDSPEPKPLNTPIKLSPAEFMKAYIKRIMNVNFFLGIFWALPASIILYYYIGTVHLHLAQLIEDFSTYVMIFMGVATASAIIMAPLYGKFIAKFGLLRGLVTNTTVGLLWCSLVCIPVLQVQIASFVVFGCFRVMLSTSWATYVVETFGSQHFGQLCGIGWFIFAMSNQVQLLLVKLVVSITGGQFLYIDIGVGCASALSYIACFVMWKRHKKPTTDPTTTADQPTDTPPAEA